VAATLVRHTETRAPLVRKSTATPASATEKCCCRPRRGTSQPVDSARLSAAGFVISSRRWCLVVPRWALQPLDITPERAPLCRPPPIVAKGA
jgi:hypothetical protein